MGTSIFQTLKLLQLTSLETRSIFNDRTRDVDDLIVWKDNVSGVIYIDDFYTSNETYIDGSYRKDEHVTLQSEKPDFEQITDAKRRFESNLKYVAGKNIIDFGCGRGDFLHLAKDHCSSVCGVELQKDFVDVLNSEGIRCVNNLDDIADNTLDVCVSFHVIEHLPNPLETLETLKKKIVSGGTILIEVPHANDILLSTLNNNEFKQFTLWSQHLVLHTRESLRRMLDSAGFENVQIEGVQRYPLSNHLNWLANSKGGGHKSPLSAIDSPILQEAYSNSLARIDATDTLIAIANVY
ncbi:class I SAM-dependent methyltransferase [Oceanospirillaceae bacterium]|nr:class I SAM-dependent methyltransferase [Oceanospirillaceae bacterium]